MVRYGHVAFLLLATLACEIIAGADVTDADADALAAGLESTNNDSRAKHLFMALYTVFFRRTRLATVAIIFDLLR